MSIVENRPSIRPNVPLLCFCLAALWVPPALADAPCAPVIDAQLQEKVELLIQTAVARYWRGEPTNATAGGSSINSTNVEAIFREASRLMPDRLDLRFGIAASVVSQALRTNGPQLELKMKEALQVYQEIQALDTNGFAAGIWYVAYARAIGETNASRSMIEELMAVHPQRTRDYLEKFRMADRILESSLNEKPQKTMPKDNHHAIVVLGAMLETNGTIKVKLTGRLQQGLKLARIYRRAPIILTGGNQKSGITEAYAMSRWFRHRGVSRKRLYLEDQAKDTVGNAIFSAAILQKLGVTEVTVVTSANHIRRGLVDLEEACLQRGLRLRFNNLAAKGEPDLDKEQEKVAIYRDLMRASGLWAFPGLQR